jgi:hypothetical protein
MKSIFALEFSWALKKFWVNGTGVWELEVGNRSRLAIANDVWGLSASMTPYSSLFSSGIFSVTEGAIGCLVLYAL